MQSISGALEEVAGYQWEVNFPNIGFAIASGCLAGGSMVVLSKEATGFVHRQQRAAQRLRRCKSGNP
jgi:hypothetical protein